MGMVLTLRDISGVKLTGFREQLNVELEKIEDQSMTIIKVGRKTDSDEINSIVDKPWNFRT